MNFFDTHCHIDFHQYDDDRAAMLQRAHAAGVRRLLIPAVDFASIQRAQALADPAAGIWLAVGIHPNSTTSWNGDEVARLRELAHTSGAVAIGEIGLDYHWDKSPPATQKRAFEQQLELAAALNLPVIIHNREASADVLPILENWVAGLGGARAQHPGVLHSFSDTPAYAERALNAGFYLGFTGPITYKNADTLRTVAALVPAERILIETDAPFLTPHPHRGKRNEPAYVPLVAERLAALRGVSLADFATQSTQNGLRLFALGGA